MLSKLLKENTTHAHEALEDIMYAIDIFNKSIDINKYKNLINILSIVHKNIEPRIFSCIDRKMSLALQLPSRSKLRALELDRQVLNILIDEADMSAIPIPHYNSQAEALGGLYVLEGATLGGNVILRHLKQVAAFQHLSFNYYGIYKNQLAAKWKDFLSILDSTNQDAYNSCIQKANETFIYFSEVAKAATQKKYLIV